MTRLNYFAAQLAMATLMVALSSVPVFAVNSSGSARVEHVAVHGSGDAAEVEIQTSGAKIAPNTQVVTGPDRIIVDFPGALPAAELHAFALKVNSGALREVRAGLFFNNPPITRVVLDLAEPRSYQISTTHDGIVVKLGPATPGVAKLDSPKPDLAKASLGKTDKVTAWGPDSPGVTVVRTPRLQNALLATGTKAAPTRVLSPVATSRISSSGAPSSVVHSANVHSPVVASPIVGSPVVASTVTASRMIASPVAASPLASAPVVAAVVVPAPVVAPLPPALPLVTVTFSNGMLTIHSDKATLAQVLFQVQQQTQAEIAIPAGAEQEEVISDLGPAPAREVLASLLNGSPYNFIFVGSESSLERVILTRRDPNIF
jgi:AMIN domain